MIEVFDTTRILPKECSYTIVIQTSVFQMRTPFFYYKLLSENFSENFEVVQNTSIVCYLSIF